MTMEIQRARRRWLVVALVLAMAIALGFMAFQALDSPSAIEYYRVVDERSLAVGTVSGPHAWARTKSSDWTVWIVSPSTSNSSHSSPGSSTLGDASSAQTPPSVSSWRYPSSAALVGLASSTRPPGSRTKNASKDCSTRVR
jgi:hypothetical protein